MHSKTPHASLRALLAVSCFGLGFSAEAQITITDPDFTNAASVESESGNLYRVNTADFDIWEYNTNYWTYDATNDQFDFDSDTDFRGWPVTQLIETGATDTTGSYSLEINYDANNVDDAGTREASII